ncbi:MAG: iron-containing alcohol dehydrogenase, partial [Polyangiales bacterium]
GIAVAVAAPAVFARFAPFCPERHLEAAALLGADTRGAALADGGPLLAERVIALSRVINLPNGCAGVGYTAADLDDLIAGTLPQQRLLANAPCDVDADCLRELFAGAMTYW